MLNVLLLLEYIDHTHNILNIKYLLWLQEGFLELQQD